MKLLNNAVLDNMLTTRFRNWRPVLLITLYNLLLLGVIAVIMGFSSLMTGSDTNVSGVVLYYSLVIFQFSLIVLIMPAITSGMISGERERKTMDLLLCTQMTPFGIISGKLLSGCMFMVLCVVCSIPMVTLAYLYGGISMLSILSIIACYLVTIIVIGSLGIFFSVLFKRTTAAVVVSYLTVFILGVVSTIGGYIEIVVQASLNQTAANFMPSYPVLWVFNPAMALIEVLGSGGTGGNGQMVPLGTIMSMGGTGVWPTMWGWELLILLAISALLIFLSTRILSPRKGWQSWKNGGDIRKPVK